MTYYYSNSKFEYQPNVCIGNAFSIIENSFSIDQASAHFSGRDLIVSYRFDNDTQSLPWEPGLDYQIISIVASPAKDYIFDLDNFSDELNNETAYFAGSILVPGENSDAVVWFIRRNYVAE